MSEIDDRVAAVAATQHAAFSLAQVIPDLILARTGGKPCTHRAAESHRTKWPLQQDQAAERSAGTYSLLGCCSARLRRRWLW